MLLRLLYQQVTFRLYSNRTISYVVQLSMIVTLLNTSICFFQVIIMDISQDSGAYILCLFGSLAYKISLQFTRQYRMKVLMRCCPAEGSQKQKQQPCMEQKLQKLIILMEFLHSERKLNYLNSFKILSIY